MNVVRRFFDSERGPKLWKWALLQTLIVWATGATFWFIDGMVTVAKFAGAGTLISILLGLILFFASVERTFFIMAVAGIADFLSFSIPMGFSFAFSLGLFGAVILLTATVLLDYTIRRLGFGWDSPMWQGKKEVKEVDVTGLPKELRTLIQGSAKQ